MSADWKEMEDRVQRVWAEKHNKDTRSRMIQQILEEMTEEEKGRAVRDWIASKLWKLEKAKKERIRCGST